LGLINNLAMRVFICIEREGDCRSR
jgi:hypothetical protein